jgi:Tol biopolymer transport system component/predicted Ser/Thr protein kinase
VIGETLGPYQILAKLGQGGMGEVYRARDSKLKREVALKVLPADVANDRERLARFQREAEVLASLNHPHIAQIYGLEDKALVMELVEGEDLAERLKRGPISIDEALPIAKQIAVALETAHEQGIIHRDLKPANIKLRPDGTVKVLDFGLAKAMDSGTGSRESGVGNTLADSPTITSPAMTMRGVILGTAAYMSPEQAKGKAVDKRADIWAFGCVLYEMLAGVRAFEAEDITDTIAAVVTRDPDWSRLPPATPAAVRRLLARCLTKDRKHRLRDIGDAHHELVDDGPAVTAAARVPAQRLPWYVAATALAAAALLAVPAVSHWRETRVAPAPLRLTIDGPAGSARLLGPEVSPDGRTVAFAALATGERTPQLWIRRLDEPLPKLVPGPVNPNGPPFWSPGGDALAVQTRDGLVHVDLSTGGTRVLTSLRSTMVGVSQFSGSWSRDNVLLYGLGSMIFRVSDRGGDAMPVTLEGLGAGADIRYPAFLPDGRRFLFYARDQGRSHLYVGSLDGGPVTRLFPSDSQGVYTEPAPGAGHVLYVVDDNLMAQPFDVAGLRPLGSPYIVAANVPLYTAEFIGTGRGAFSVSPGGVLVYRTDSETQLQRLVWLNRAGKEIGTMGEAGLYFGPRISPDGRRVAVARLDPKTRLGDIHVLAEEGPALRLTFDEANDLQPVWSPDGQQVIWGSQRGKTSALVRKRADGSGAEEVLHRSEHPLAPDDVSRDGRLVVFRETHPVTRNDLWILPLDGSGEARPLLNTGADEPRARFSPDGQLISYLSDASGRVESYLQSFPDMVGKWQVNDSTANMPQWRRDGREIYYSTGPTLWARPVIASKPLQMGSAVALFTPPATPRGSFYHVDGDGQRFLFAPERYSADLLRYQVAIGWMKP